jgi:transposase
VNTSDQAPGVGRQRRRRHSAAFKSESVAACRQPGVSIAAIAMSRGVNANLLRRWVVEAERTGASAAGPQVEKPARVPAIEGSPASVPVALTAKSDDGSIRLEVRRGSSTIVVQWPASAAQVCAMLLRELLR